MHIPEFLSEILILLGASSVAAVLFERLRLPSVLGFLIAGMIVGPNGLRLITNLEHVSTMAEFGVVLLMLTIGLEFTLERVRSLIKIALWGGSLQILISTAISLLLAWWLGDSLGQGLITGFVIALSSTAIVLKHLLDRGEMETQYGRICFAILIFQDLAVPVMILVIQSLGSAGGHFTLSLGWALLKALLFLGGTVLGAKFIIFPLLQVAAQQRNRETLFLLVVATCLVISFISAKLGLSLAIGAFLAGLILANTDFGFQVIGDIAPLRHLFVSLFFVSIGLLFDVSFAAQHVLQIAWMVGAILFVNAAIVTGVVIALRFSPRVALASGLMLCQIGEFAFVLIQIARQQAVVTEDFYRLVMATAFITLFLSPFLFALIPRVLGLFERVRWFGVHPDEWNKRVVPDSRLKEHVIVCGYGVVGADLSTTLKAEGIPFIVIEMSPRLVEKARLNKVRIIAGDVSNLEVLERAGIEHAKAVVISFSDPMGMVQALGVVRRLRPDVYIMLRTRHQTSIGRLYEMGADLVVLEEWEASVQMNQRILEYWQRSPAKIKEHIDSIRARQEIKAEEIIMRHGRTAPDLKNG